MLHLASLALAALYILLPPAMFAWALAGRHRHGRAWPLVSLGLIAITGTAAALGLLLLNGYLLQGYVPLADSLQFIYFTISAICLLKLIDWTLLTLFFRAARVRLDPLGRPLSSSRFRALAALLPQRILMLAITLVYVVSLLIVYRPRIIQSGDPQTAMDREDYALARFVSKDGIELAGWWIPASEPPNALEADLADQWATHAVILCHGVGSGKQRMLSLASALCKAGYNVLAFDFRAHGQSTGHLITYGDRERHDVLAAVRWIKSNHPREARRLLGIGINTGAAALLAAAADPADGRQIDAIVLCEPFARFRSLAHAAAETSLPPSLATWVPSASLPLASLHAGANLASFAPIDLVDHIWPRPIFVVHGRGETFIPLWEEMDLYQRASVPKQQYWPPENYAASRQRLRRLHNEAAIITELFRHWLGLTNTLLDDPALQHRTLEFLREAQPAPVL